MARRSEAAVDGCERRALPLHLRPAAAALFDALPAPPLHAAEDAVEAVEDVRSRLATCVPAGTEVTVDAYRARLVASCPASAADSDEAFTWTPASAARHLGLRAVALHLCPGFPPVEDAVRAVVTEHVDNGGYRTPGPWLARLDPAGRAVAEAHARRWAEQAVAWLPLRLVGAGALRFLEDDWWPGGARGGRTLVVHGRRDITVGVGGARVAVVLAGGAARSPGMAEADAIIALAASICDRRARVVRVVRVHPASGEVVGTDVTPALLQRGVEVVGATAAALGSVATRHEVPTAPGPGCTWCARRDACPAGSSWLRRPERRSMGLPVAAPAP